ncbi:hypothetical protein [Microbacterium sp. SORGH_AS_0862]|uniref:hypothetical protein n=1 Tax=Microbacterium sp. SORGH_AS_0862 TaxID=3041789 RepID=UPI0027901A8B|nr:hypothetical protein [Microbacterium sp. SORGH_AS_0862]MDQ1205039.1 hypothetical protein [Microbacterium sp. SORGH_AS_0862]
MGTVTVHAATPISRRVAGVAFIDGVASVDEGSAAHAFFVRNDAFRLDNEVPPAGPPLTPDEVERAAAHGSASGGEEQSDKPPAEKPPAEKPPAETAPKRPHPVRDDKGKWFTYLSALKPDHGFALESVGRGELIAAVEEIEAAQASA